MTATIHTLRPHAPPRPAVDDTIRADCERLMRRLVLSRCAFEFELRDITDLLDVIVTRMERER
jgi:hypothetical protein